MDAGTDVWQSLCQEFARLVNRIDRVTSVNVNAADLRAETARVGQRYLRQVRPLLREAQLNDQLATLDEAFSALVHLSDGKNALSTYKKYIKRIRKTMPAVTTGLAMHAGSGPESSKEPTVDELQLIDMLRRMVPSAAISYRQALIDLADEHRISFRGPALELREALRETLDHMAPDEDVMAMAGFKLEKSRTGPTMKQKVRFILRARESGSAAMQVTEDAATSVEAVLGNLTRAVYNLGSVNTHVASERGEVRKLKRYIDVVLHDLLVI